MLHHSFLDEIKEELINVCVLRGNFVLASGKQSNYMINCKPFMLSPRGHYLLGHTLKNKMPPSTKAVAGYGLGGYALASAVSYSSYTGSGAVPALYIRKAIKKHGTMALIEGIENLKKGNEVVIVEDVVTTGGSVLKAAKILRIAGYKVSTVICIVDREEGGKEKLASKDLELISLVTVNDLLVK